VACDPVNYGSVDSSKWECAKEVVKREYGIDIDSDQGEATERGFTLRWSYDARAQELDGRINDTAAKCGIAAAAS
jgi:hypothetical protein